VVKQPSRSTSLLAPERQSRKAHLSRLKRASPQIFTIISRSRTIEEARRRLYRYLSGHQRALQMGLERIQHLERGNMRECLSVFKNILSKRNEALTGTSTLAHLYHLIHGTDPDLIRSVTADFVEELVHLFRGVSGRSGIYADLKRPAFLEMQGRRAARSRSRDLDAMVDTLERYLSRYHSGLEPEVVARRRRSRARILQYFGAKLDDWNHWRWHLRHVIRDERTLSELIELTPGDVRQIGRARAHHIPFGITPFYLSLMEERAASHHDLALRAQVIPPESYVSWMIQHQENRERSADFMGEHDTSPIDLVTRRYPQIVVLKPYNSCPQICVYCQRNWEIRQVLGPRAVAPREALQKAIDWIEDHTAVKEVLITGGDPLVLSDSRLDAILKRLSRINHVERIRIGTRLPVTVPQRVTPQLAALLARYQVPGRREIVVVTHVEHISEVTPEMTQAVDRFRRRGLAVYNQLVFTVFNSRRFESAALRRQLRLIGVQPYYTFMTKGKEETEAYRVPIARLLQEKREEVRLFSGMVRTDHAVFNVPRLGKTYLNAGQDHDVIMIRPDGRRIYEFFPWERNISPVDSYIHIDMPIHSYLRRLEEMGEDRDGYRTIWYYY
jgi:lysine 2,3-aminomutase